MNPSLGMFLSRDPFEGMMERIMSRNGYTYVEGNPINLSDPSGEFPAVLGLAAANPITATLLGGAALVALGCAAIPACRDAVRNAFRDLFDATDKVINECVDRSVDKIRELMEDVPFPATPLNLPSNLPNIPINLGPLGLLPLIPILLPWPNETFPSTVPIEISPILHDRVYDPTFKHSPNGFGTPMDLDDETAQDVLNEGMEISKQVYGYYEGRIYTFQPDNAGTYHGYPVAGTTVPAQYLRHLRSTNVITNSQYNRLLRQTE